MKRRILSIDFDYFIDTDIDTRNNKFPDGIDEKTEKELVREWGIMYDKYPEIHSIGVIEDFNKCCEELSNLETGKVLISNSHKDIAKLFPLIDPQDKLEVIHIDFHHDNYISSGSKLDCANWVRHLMQLRYENTRIEWIRRNDSETVSLEGVFPYYTTRDFRIDGEYDYIFICLSPEWTPPHLIILFEELCKSVSHLEYI